MQTLIQKIHVEEQFSFACRTYKTPQFETNWHKHEEYELIVITEGYGTAMMGDYVGNYNKGDVFFIAGNVPHWFRKSHHKMIGSAVVVHFKKDCWGESFINLPELKKINQLLNSRNHTIQLKKSLQQKTAAVIKALESSTGIERIFMLMDCLQQIGQSNAYKVLTYDFESNNNQHENSVIEKIINYSFKHCLEPVTLRQVAALADMSIPTFCRFFKRNIKKTYFDFLAELRIGHACKLLQNTAKPVLDVCYNSGYNSWAHFSKQFKKVKTITPSQYRKQFKN